MYSDVFRCQNAIVNSYEYKNICLVLFSEGVTSTENYAFHARYFLFDCHIELVF